eukprot:TRINITY_DN37206_c0_g1_i3.p1 TRINITY_DN37206_c0_g1~~TRINITY_DN37206_c0_g1_i3.p1  ORF type:complete len:302 (-),score=-7.75 TRINITY_DN37206_c0_g1_i3:698-1603(-)
MIRKNNVNPHYTKSLLLSKKKVAKPKKKEASADSTNNNSRTVNSEHLIQQDQNNKQFYNDYNKYTNYISKSVVYTCTRLQQILQIFPSTVYCNTKHPNKKFQSSTFFMILFTSLFVPKFHKKSLKNLQHFLNRILLRKCSFFVLNSQQFFQEFFLQGSGSFVIEQKCSFYPLKRTLLILLSLQEFLYKPVFISPFRPIFCQVEIKMSICLTLSTTKQILKSIRFRYTKTNSFNKHQFCKHKMKKKFLITSKKYFSTQFLKKENNPKQYQQEQQLRLFIPKNQKKLKQIQETLDKKKRQENP